MLDSRYLSRLLASRHRTNSFCIKRLVQQGCVLCYVTWTKEPNHVRLCTCTTDQINTLWDKWVFECSKQLDFTWPLTTFLHVGGQNILSLNCDVNQHFLKDILKNPEKFARIAFLRLKHWMDCSLGLDSSLDLAKNSFLIGYILRIARDLKNSVF